MEKPTNDSPISMPSKVGGFGQVLGFILVLRFVLPAVLGHVDAGTYFLQVIPTALLLILLGTVFVPRSVPMPKTVLWRAEDGTPDSAWVKTAENPLERVGSRVALLIGAEFVAWLFWSLV